MPNVLRHFLATTGKVPIIHLADTALTIGQGAREGQPRHDHWPPSGCLPGLDYQPSTSRLRGSVRHVDGEATARRPAGPGGYGVDAAFMLLLLHEGGIHAF